MFWPRVARGTGWPSMTARLACAQTMAKFEEADPRWKVKDLGDQGKNVGGWCVCIASARTF
jgi:hypothetical protein